MQFQMMRMSLTQRRQMILEGNPLKALLYLSLPTLIMTIVQSGIPLTDGLFLNNHASIAVAAAVGFAVPIINTLISLSQGLSVATMSILGQMFGRGEFEKVRHCASQTIFYTFLTGCVIAPLSFLSAWFFSFRVDPEIAEPLLHYLGIYSLVIPFIFCTAVYNGIKSSLGQPEANLIRMVILFALKIFFNSIFLAWLEWGEYGAVLASLGSYICITLWMFYDLYWAPSEMRLNLRDIRPDPIYLKTLIKLAIPSMLAAMMASLGFILINMEVQAFGKLILNAQTISSNINALTFSLPSSISSTVTVMVSMHIGINNNKSAKKIYLMGLGLSLLLSAILIAIFIPSAPFLVKLFRQEPDIVEIAVRALNIYTWSTIAFGVFMVTNGVFIGLGRTKMTLISGFLRIWLFRYLFIRLFVDRMGVDSVFWGNLFSNCLTALIFLVIVFLIPWKNAIKNLDDITGGPVARGHKPR